MNKFPFSIFLVFYSLFTIPTLLRAQALTGIKTIGGISPTYINITAAVAALNTNGVGSGGVTFNITAGYSDTVVNLTVTAVGTAANPIVFKKNGPGANPILYGIKGTGTTDAVVTLKGTRYVTFDGIDIMDSTTSGTGTTQMESGYWVTNSSATFGSCLNTIKNCMITLRRTNFTTALGSTGITQKTTIAVTNLSGSNHNNRYENIRIQNCYYGILLTAAALYPDSNNIITASGTDSTIIGANTPNDIGNGNAIVNGIQCQNQKNVEVSRCVIRNLTGTGIQACSGIWINNPNTSVNYGKAKVFNNTVYNLARTNAATGTGNMTGIRIDVSSTAESVVYNNIVYGIYQTTKPANPTANIILRGITLGQSGTGHGLFYNNTVSINDTTLFVTSAAFWKVTAGLVGPVTLRNNIFSNTTANQVTTDPAKHYACYLQNGSTVSSNNILWAPNDNGFIGRAIADRATLPMFAAAISPGATPGDGNELGSAHANPNFVSETNLSIAGPSAAAKSGTPIADLAIPTDILGITRNTTNPTIGAFETSYPVADSSAPIINNVVVLSKSIGGNSYPIVYADIHDNNDTGSAAGSVMLWYREGSSGIFLPAPPDSVPVNRMNGTYKWDIAFSGLFAGTYQFYIAARDSVKEGVHIAVNPIQDTSYIAFSSVDPVNYINNPHPTVRTATLIKQSNLSGTYYVGATGQYAKLKDVANAIATSFITGDVVFELLFNYDGTVGETFPMNFPDPICIGGNWSIIIRPIFGVASMETSGAPASGVPMIRLNGAKRITFDGRPGGTGTSEWTIRNKATTGNIAPCFVFTNGAQHDTLQYLKMESASKTGTILFSTSDSPGNKYNYIANSIIRDRSDIKDLVPDNGIVSTGSAGFPNDSNTIINNQILNYGSLGVKITETGNGNRWIIDGNHFYNNIDTLLQFQFNPPATTQGGISILAPATSGHLVQNNFIGGSEAFCGDTAWISPSFAGWRGIAMTVAAGTDSSYIRNNTIQNVLASSGIYALWALDIGNGTISISNNMIGHPTIPNSLQSARASLFAGLSIQTGTGKITVYNNTFANLTQTSTTNTVGLTGIQSIISGNIIIRNNLFHSFSGEGIATSKTSSSVRAMFVSGTANYVIDHNTINNLSSTGGPSNTASTSCQGIVVASGSGIVSNNRINGLINTTSNTTGEVNGINNNGGTWQFYNNAISLGYNIDYSVILTGILLSSSQPSSVYYNTVRINGAYTGSSPTQTSTAFKRTSSSVTDIRNNIFSNTRTGYSTNYAIANTSTTPTIGWKANYNNLHAANAAQTGLWNTTATDLATWKTTSIHDTSSISIAPAFISNTDLQLTAPSLGNFSFAGRPLVGITTDIDGQIRHTVYPYMGAYESLTNPLPVKLLSLSAQKANRDIDLSWSTVSETNSKSFAIERSFDQNVFVFMGSVKAAGNSSQKRTYHFNDQDILLKTTSGVIYYRLKMIDNDGRFEYSNTVSVSIAKEQSSAAITVSPNPFKNDLFIQIVALQNEIATVTIYDIAGTKVLDATYHVSEGLNTLQPESASALKSGLYFISVEMNGTRCVKKIIKE
jgi:hypothetical protein